MQMISTRACVRARRYLVLIRLPFVKHTLANVWEGDQSVREALLPGRSAARGPNAEHR